jgi:EAL and modified HD-GYP domain-containing signal transduction protein
VLSDAILTFGLGELTGKKPAFVNFSRELLLSGAATLASPASLVIEVLEDVVVDADVVEACRNLHGRGYAVGLDDFVPGTQADALLPYVKFIKVDVLQTTVARLTHLASHFRPLGLTLIAEKVETGEMAAAVLESGCHLMQGFYFCRPTTFSTTPLPARQLTHVQLLGALSRENLSVQELEDLIKRDPSLSLRVLRSVNSAASAVRREITSLHQALVLLGRDKVRKWAAVWTLAGMNTTGTGEIVAVALLRARCCELLGDALEGTSDAGFFLLGLCSLLDVIVGRPMVTALADLPLSRAIADALLGGRNQARVTLDAVIRYEQGDWGGAAVHMAAIGLPFDTLPSAYADALRWAHELSNLE